MDAAVLFKTADLIIKFLGSPIAKEIKSIWKNEEQIKMLADTVGYIGDVLSDVEGKQFNEESVKRGYNKLREVYLDAEDFLDRVETLRKTRDADTRPFKKGRLFLSRSNQAKYAIEVHNAIKEIRKKLDAISQDLQNFSLSEYRIKSEVSHTTARASGSYVDVTRIIGREEEKKIIVDMFLRSPVEQHKIRVVSIVGIGGMGKTTTAQLVYDDESWQGRCRFDLKLWVSDSKTFDLKSLLKNILHSISPNNASLVHLEEDHLRDRLVKEICGKRFFLVLDDVENEDPWFWETFEALLNYGDKDHSRILVTTRSRKVASIVGSSDSTYQLEGLSEYNAVQLFERYAFQKTRDENLGDIGKHIVQKCRGVPLAIKVIGSLLQGENKCKWELLRDIGLGKLKKESNQLMPILKLSYDHLDSELQQCFAYCSLFRINHRISKEILSNIWMVNIHFKTTEGETLEDVCNRNFEILCSRSFLEVEVRKRLDDYTYFKMHDLMHDLAKEVAGPEILMAKADSNSDKLIIEENVRHLSLMYAMKNIEPSGFQLKGRRMRTLLGCYLFICWEPFDVRKLVSDCPVLRYLDLGGCRIEILTDSIGMLIHLRYLNLSSNRFKTLPDSITKLINLRHLKVARCNTLTHLPSRIGGLTSLKVLDMSDCVKLEELPVGVEKLTNLKHLKLACCMNLTHMPPGMRALTSLQVLDLTGCGKLEELPRGIEKLTNLNDLKLSSCDSLTRMPSGMGALMSVCRPHRFIVSHSESKHCLLLEELGLISELIQGELIIEFPNTITVEEPGDDDAFLLNKKSLRGLNIMWKDFILEEEASGKHMNILAKLQPPPNLEELTLQAYQGVTFPAWVPKDEFASILPNLERIYIWACGRCRHLPPISRLPRLKYLKLDWLSSLEYIEDDVSAASFFPSLTELYLGILPELKGWCRGELEQEESLMLPSFPRLLDLQISGCPNLMVEPILVSFGKVFAVNRNAEKELSGKREETMSTPTLSSSSVSLLAQACRNGGGFGLSMEEENHQLYFRISNWNASDITSMNMVEAFREMSKHLTRLVINYCPGLKTLPRGLLQHLTTLQELEIRHCVDFDFTGEEDGEMPWKNLQSLQRLSLSFLPMMGRLPEGVQLVTSLQQLHISNCHNFTAPEWLHNSFEEEYFGPWRRVL